MMFATLRKINEQCKIVKCHEAWTICHSYTETYVILQRQMVNVCITFLNDFFNFSTTFLHLRYSR